jgi:hypothetical protein
MLFVLGRAIGFAMVMHHLESNLDLAPTRYVMLVLAGGGLLAVRPSEVARHLLPDWLFRALAKRGVTT